MSKTTQELNVSYAQLCMKIGDAESKAFLAYEEATRQRNIAQDLYEQLKQLNLEAANAATDTTQVSGSTVSQDSNINQPGLQSS